MRSTAHAWAMDDRETSQQEAVLDLAARVRRRRLARRWRQSDVAEHAGVSQDQVSRMELGRGGGIALDAWLAVARVLEIDLCPSRHVPGEVALRTVERLARGGGWEVTREEAGLRLEREARHPTGRPLRPWLEPHEIALVRAVDVLIALGPWLDRLESAALAELGRVDRPTGASGLLVVDRTEANRRRIRTDPDLPRVGQGGFWLGALRSASAPMPRTPGILWIDPRSGNLAVLRPLS
jgi:transcriptional regulator with XRE-family HTH domain